VPAVYHSHKLFDSVWAFTSFFFTFMRENSGLEWRKISSAIFAFISIYLPASMIVTSAVAFILSFFVLPYYLTSVV